MGVKNHELFDFILGLFFCRDARLPCFSRIKEGMLKSGGRR